MSRSRCAERIRDRSCCASKRTTISSGSWKYCEGEGSRDPVYRLRLSVRKALCERQAASGKHETTAFAYNKRQGLVPWRFSLRTRTPRERLVMMGAVCWSLTLPLLLGAVQDDLPAGWEVYASKDGRFTVHMPKEPRAPKKQVVRTKTGDLNVTLVVAEGPHD